jgi:hypothetical protein
MYEVQVANITAGRAIELKQQVQNRGLIMDQDFSWSYSPPNVNNWSVNYKLEDSNESELPWDININNENSGKVTFTFKDPAVASFFRIKWA